MIEFAGLEIPLLSLVAEPSNVVLGNRRAALIKTLKHFEEVPVYVARTPEDIARWCDADRELEKWNAGPEGMPWTWRQQAQVLDAALTGLATQGGGGRAMPRPPGATDVLAAYFGRHEVQLRNAMYLLRFEQAGGPVGERARQALDLVEAGEIKAQSVYRKLRNGDPIQVGVSAPKPGATVAQQEKALRNAADALAGITHGLRAIGDIDPAMTADARAALMPPLVEARTTLSRLVRQLGRHDKGDEA